MKKICKNNTVKLTILVRALSVLQHLFIYDRSKEGRSRSRNKNFSFTVRVHVDASAYKDIVSYLESNRFCKKSLIPALKEKIIKLEKVIYFNRIIERMTFLYRHRKLNFNIIEFSTVNLSFLKRYHDCYQTLASFFKFFKIFNNRSCN